MAEYLFIGSIDVYIVMWMCDVVLNDDILMFDDFNNFKYFFYWYGQVFWVFFIGLKGDEIIEFFFKGVVKYGFEEVFKWVLGMIKDDLFKFWVDGFRCYFGVVFDIMVIIDCLVGWELIGIENGGCMNVVLEISFNGWYVIFLFEKDFFFIDFFLADVCIGEIICKVVSSICVGYIDDFNYIESFGVWLVNSWEFVFVVFSKGCNILVVKDVESGKIVWELCFDGLQAFSNLDWLFDGKYFVVMGLDYGEIDFYFIDVCFGEVEQFIDDVYLEMYFKWVENGNQIVFLIDCLACEWGCINGCWAFNLVIFDMVSLCVEDIDVFFGVDNFNLVFDIIGNIIFLFNCDGFCNIYCYELYS